MRDDLIAYFQNQQKQIGMIVNTVQRILGMQSQLAAELRETTYQVGVNWTKVLGASIDLVDPRTGDLYTTFDTTYQWYCIAPAPYGRRVLGTNDPSDIASPACDRELKRTP